MVEQNTKKPKRSIEQILADLRKVGKGLEKQEPVAEPVIRPVTPAAQVSEPVSTSVQEPRAVTPPPVRPTTPAPIIIEPAPRPQTPAPATGEKSKDYGFFELDLDSELDTTPKGNASEPRASGQPPPIPVRPPTPPVRRASDDTPEGSQLFDWLAMYSKDPKALVEACVGPRVRMDTVKEAIKLLLEKEDRVSLLNITVRAEVAEVKTMADKALDDLDKKVLSRDLKFLIEYCSTRMTINIETLTYSLEKLLENENIQDFEKRVTFSYILERTINNIERTINDAIKFALNKALVRLDEKIIRDTEEKAAQDINRSDNLKLLTAYAAMRQSNQDAQISGNAFEALKRLGAFIEALYAVKELLDNGKTIAHISSVAKVTVFRYLPEIVDAMLNAISEGRSKPIEKALHSLVLEDNRFIPGLLTNIRSQYENAPESSSKDVLLSATKFMKAFLFYTSDNALITSETFNTFGEIVGIAATKSAEEFSIVIETLKDIILHPTGLHFASASGDLSIDASGIPGIQNTAIRFLNDLRKLPESSYPYLNKKVIEQARRKLHGAIQSRANDFERSVRTRAAEISGVDTTVENLRTMPIQEEDQLRIKRDDSMIIELSDISITEINDEPLPPTSPLMAAAISRSDDSAINLSGDELTRAIAAGVEASVEKVGSELSAEITALWTGLNQENPHIRKIKSDELLELARNISSLTGGEYKLRIQGVLIERLKIETDVQVVRSIAYALEEIGNDDAHAALLEAYERFPMIAPKGREGVFAGERDAVLELSEVKANLDNEDKQVRINAINKSVKLAESLNEQGKKEVSTLLLTRLIASEIDSQVRIKIMESYEQITAQIYGNLTKRFLRKFYREYPQLHPKIDREIFSRSSLLEGNIPKLRVSASKDLAKIAGRFDENKDLRVNAIRAQLLNALYQEKDSKTAVAIAKNTLRIADDNSLKVLNRYVANATFDPVSRMEIRKLLNRKKNGNFWTSRAAWKYYGAEGTVLASSVYAGTVVGPIASLAMGALGTASVSVPLLLARKNKVVSRSLERGSLWLTAAMFLGASAAIYVTNRNREVPRTDVSIVRKVEDEKPVEKPKVQASAQANIIAEQPTFQSENKTDSDMVTIGTVSINKKTAPVQTAILYMNAGDVLNARKLALELSQSNVLADLSHAEQIYRKLFEDFGDQKYLVLADLTKEKIQTQLNTAAAIREGKDVAPPVKETQEPPPSQEPSQARREEQVQEPVRIEEPKKEPRAKDEKLNERKPKRPKKKKNVGDSFDAKLKLLE